MADIRLYLFPSKGSPVPADIIYAGNSANSFDEIQITIAQLISAYPNLSGIAGLTMGNNTYAYVNSGGSFVAGTITAVGVNLLSLTTVTTMPTDSAFAGWDANSNMSANNFIQGYATTATVAGTTTLTVASSYLQFFTGSTTQTVVLPVTSTLVLGQQFNIVNASSGAVTVESSGANTVTTLTGGTSAIVTCILTSGTSAASWYVT